MHARGSSPVDCAPNFPSISAMRIFVRSTRGPILVSVNQSLCQTIEIIVPFNAVFSGVAVLGLRQKLEPTFGRLRLLARYWRPFPAGSVWEGLSRRAEGRGQRMAQAFVPHDVLGILTPLKLGILIEFNGRQYTTSDEASK